MGLPKGVEKHFSGDSNGYTRMLDDLWKNLCDNLYGEQTGPYPANHGKKHVTKIVERLSDLLDSFKDIPQSDKFEIFAAGMIHDVGMIKMLPTGSDSEIAERSRDNHANFDQIKNVLENGNIRYLHELNYTDGKRLESSERKRIMLIASGHAGDNGISAECKQKEVEKESAKYHLLRGMRILRLADYMDLGQDRLATTWKEHCWSEKQIRHLKQHKVIEINVDPINRLIHVVNTLKNDEFVLEDESGNTNKIVVSPIEVIAILRTVHEKIRPILKQFNEKADENKQWQLVSLDERQFGVVWPRVSGLGLFYGVLKEQLERTREEGPLPIDLMGHSLYGRFFRNEEALNDLLIKHLKNGNIKMRILLLDPHIENQQTCEVYDAQKKLTSEEVRSILPSYDENGQVIDRGDILESLEKLENVWREKVGQGSALEVRLTNRLMYMNLSRYGNTVIVTPYSGRGLFNSSIGLLHGEESVLNEAYINEFESIWESPWETRLHMHVDKSNEVINPIHRLIPSSTVVSPTIHPLNYERYFLQYYTDRVIAVFNYVKTNRGVLPPPVEVEVQPSSVCNLRCWHCIGKNLPYRREVANEYMSPGQADTLLTWKAGKFSVQRFRISGLLGDPLHELATEFTLDFLRKAKVNGKHTVLFTNGLGIKESDFDRLLSADNIHVSLDAEKPNTFKHMKGASEGDFEKIKNNLRTISSKKKIGIGFVVNETNVSEVNGAIEFAKNIGASFIRFKPDIRPTRAIPWRTWREAEQMISKAQEKDNDGLDIVMTNVAWQHSRVPSSERCWAQYFFASIAPTGKIHVCDHLTESNGETSIGDLDRETDIKTLWADAIKNKMIGNRTAHCQLCPPYNWHINRLLDQLFVLYEQYGKNKLKEWIYNALQNDRRD